MSYLVPASKRNQGIVPLTAIASLILERRPKWLRETWRGRRPRNICANPYIRNVEQKIIKTKAAAAVFRNAILRFMANLCIINLWKRPQRQLSKTRPLRARGGGARGASRSRKHN